jgi:hypothetical protein
MQDEPKNRAKRPKRFTILAAGTHQGFKATVAAITRAAHVPSSEVVVTTVDPEPGRAATAAAMVEARGIMAHPIVDRIENIADEPADVLVNQTDRAGTLAEVAAIAERRRLPLLAYLIIAFRDRLLGLQMALGPEDRVAREGVRGCSQTLDRLTARGGSERVTGEQAPVAFQIAEEGLRASFSKHAEENLSKLVSGRVPTAHPIEAVWGGTREGVPTVISRRETLGVPQVVAREAIAGYAVPIPWDTNVLVIEVLPEALVFHEVRVRHDGRLTVQGSSNLDQTSLVQMSEMSALSQEIDLRREGDSDFASDLVEGAAMFLVGNIVANGAAFRDGLGVEVRSSTHVTAWSPVRTTD